MAAPSSPGPFLLPPNIGEITSSQLIGTLLNFFLFGTLTIQVYVYIACFPKDRPAIKSLVYFVFLTMAVCACLNAADAHYWYGAHFGDIAAFAQPGFSPFYTPLMGSLIALAVQLFFCYRISVFGSSTSASAMWWAVSVLIAAISLLQAAGGTGGGIIAFIASNAQHDYARTRLVYMWLVGDAVADVMIAVSMTYLLMQASTPLAQTQSIVRGVVRLIVETNTFSASIAILGLALFAGMPGTDYFICPTMILPGIYANTLLVMLNNRAAASRSSSHYVSSEDPSYLGSGTANGTGTDNANCASSSTANGTGKFNSGGADGPRTRGARPDAEIGAFTAAANPNPEAYGEDGGEDEDEDEGANEKFLDQREKSQMGPSV
ncbi:hypothetical protein DFH08DRAFT_1079842 [Mycena albidolilacea]|uniref:DUF6534 domain-containing protein n=1 Tax=Mycena albidolilacea TaxID=1033008 RepID=A0AAD7ESA4_9AGAR|nr:hypothetical protein DFH08DRAFT_1079842 [Mycena albidolilacea]